ncbi:hypothetical protein L3X38_042389 [Prunus dulcis]|uniref:Uncharacterized protein n=1 Tax=Prunus dulcis TaxID=3755 RepID=A0AAD4UUG8_PRUDU|nr:hypothetical protein L3X38_042389 [Prunus dulcis]
MNYNGYDSYGSNSQSIGQHGDHNHYGQYKFTHQGGPNNHYDSSSQFGGQYGGHNCIGDQNGLNDQHGFGGQTNQVHGANTFTHIAKTVPPIRAMSLIIIPTLRLYWPPLPNSWLSGGTPCTQKKKDQKFLPSTASAEKRET